MNLKINNYCENKTNCGILVDFCRRYCYKEFVHSGIVKLFQDTQDDMSDEPEQDLTDYAELRLKEYSKWRGKLSRVVHCHPHCGMCLEGGGSVWSVEACITVAELGPQECTLRHILVALFGEEIIDSMANDIICEECTDKAIQSYLFIQNTKKTSKILFACLENLEENVEHTLTQVENVQEFEKSIICLSLEEILTVNFDEIENRTTSDSTVKKFFDCTQCNRRFASLDGLRKHEAKHTNNTNEIPKPIIKHNKLSITQCSICKLVVLDVELKEHMKSHDRKTWHCSLCDETYYSSNSFDTHLKTEHNKTKESLLTCDFCAKTFFSNDDLQSHKCKYRCSECLEMPCPHHKYLVSYKNQKEAGNITVQCLDCEFTCSRKISMLSHANVDHLHRFNNVCDECGDSFQSKPALMQHKLKFHNESYICEYCNNNFGSQRLLDKHLVICETSEKPCKCEMCPATFLYEELLLKHKEKHTQNELACSLCSVKFATNEELNDHKKEVHKVTISCTMCEEDFDCNVKYREHLSEHPLGTKHICRVCKASFNSKLNHRKHIKWHEMSLDKLICPYCSKNVSSCYLRAHMAIHSKDKTAKGLKLKKKSHLVRNFECDLCRKRFVSENVLKRHREIHKDHKKCHVCQKYVKPAMLDSHVEDHKLEDQGIKPKSWMKKIFKCGKCEYITHYPLCIEAHENRVHLKVRPFKCDACGKDFHARNSLTEHLKSHDESGGSRKVCGLCGKLFANSQCLKKHMRIHTGEKPYPCDECGDLFMTASRRQEHRIRRHSTPSVACPICTNLYHTVRDVRAHIKKSHCNIRKGKGKTFDLEGIPEEHRYIFKDHRRFD